ACLLACLLACFTLSLENFSSQRRIIFMESKTVKTALKTCQIEIEELNAMMRRINRGGGI
ncbi:hypothetical protein P9100_04125, partial [Gallibacterium anatis]|uniref:hypothetical protein n=1 Tax=Gallibacterium anatis TaxID=750 RepID=UPI003A512363